MLGFLCGQRELGELLGRAIPQTVKKKIRKKKKKTTMSGSYLAFKITKLKLTGVLDESV